MMLLVALVAFSAEPISEEFDLLGEANAEFEKLGRVSDSTISDLRAALREAEEPQQVDLLMALGFALLPSDAEGALKPLRKALRLSKARAREDDIPITLQRTIMRTLMKLQRYGDAATVYSMYGYALDAATHQALALKLTQTAESLEEVEAAQRHSAKAVAGASDEPTSQLVRGLSLVIGEDASGREEAVSSLIAAFKLRSRQDVKDSTYPKGWPTDLEAHGWHTLGMLLASAPDVDVTALTEAVRAFKAASELAPGQEHYEHSLAGARATLVSVHARPLP